MKRSGFPAPWKDLAEKPALYHCVLRVVESRFAFGAEEKSRFRTLMRGRAKAAAGVLWTVMDLWVGIG